MLRVFEDVKRAVVLKPKPYTIDNFAFKLHYRITALTLLVATALVTSRQYIGEHIRCISDSGVPSHVMDTFCFFTATYTVVKHLNSSMLDAKFIAHPGVGPIGPLGVNSQEPIKRHAYYQWVPFVLFMQAIMFYLTHQLWKKLEGGRLRRLVEGLEYAVIAFGEKDITVGDHTIPAKETKATVLKDIRRAFLQRLYVSRTWAVNLIMCEFLNCVHLIVQIYLTDVFLAGQFLNLGPEIVTNGLDSNVDVLDVVFPKITKCTFHKYGPTGSIQSHDAMCVMALNIINDKVYVLLWFWFATLFAISIAAIFWRALEVILHRRSQSFNEYMFSNAGAGKLNPWNVIRVMRYCNFNDWLFLYYLSKNMDGMLFRELFRELANDLDNYTENPDLSMFDEGRDDPEEMMLKRIT